MLTFGCRLLVFVLFGFLLSTLHPTVFALPKCPIKCRCSLDGKHADCQGIGLGRIPAAEEFDPGLEWLDLRRNGLSHAEFSRLAGLPRLHTLALGLNPIRHLEKASAILLLLHNSFWDGCSIPWMFCHNCVDCIWQERNCALCPSLLRTTPIANFDYSTCEPII